MATGMAMSHPSQTREAPRLPPSSMAAMAPIEAGSTPVDWSIRKDPTITGAKASASTPSVTHPVRIIQLQWLS